MRDWYLANLGVLQYLPKGDTSTPRRASTPDMDEDALDEGIPETGITKADIPNLDASNTDGSNTGGSKTDPFKTDVSKTDSLKASTAHQTEDTHTAVIASIARELEETVAEVSYQKQAPEVEPVELPIEGETETVSFRLACWQPMEDLLIIDSLEPGADMGEQRSRLLYNIAAALRSYRQTHPDMDGEVSEDAAALLPDFIDWPDSATDTSRAAAVAMLAAFVEARIKMRGVCRLILMGEMAAELIGGSAVEEGLHQLPGGARACITPSLAEMLDDPSKKRLAWHAMQTLI